MRVMERGERMKKRSGDGDGDGNGTPKGRQTHRATWPSQPRQEVMDG